MTILFITILMYNHIVFIKRPVSMLQNFFSSLQMTRPNKLECLYRARTLLSSPTFAGNTRSLPKMEASEKSSNWVFSGFALKF